MFQKDKLLKNIKIKNKKLEFYNNLNIKFVLFSSYNLIKLDKYLVLYNNINFKKKFTSYINYFIINTKNVKVNLTCLKKNNIDFQITSGIVLKNLNLKEKKLKKTWKVNKLLFNIAFTYNKIVKIKTIFYFKNINTNIFKIVKILKTNKLVNKNNLICLSSLICNNKKLKKIKSIKKKFKKNFYKK